LNRVLVGKTKMDSGKNPRILDFTCRSRKARERPEVVSGAVASKPRPVGPRSRRSAQVVTESVHHECNN